MRVKLQDRAETTSEKSGDNLTAEEEAAQISALRLQNPALCSTCGTPMRKLLLGGIMMVDPDGEERPVKVYCNSCLD
ncbi:hypothetical protein LCGC14_2980290 [marine sediment metagenome]|uniref:Uncharacterized protein n=1 Tax=marine sediment metagenome TaxID=412755 RepID=A0A0F8ZEB0_9ZZZZ